MNPLQTDEPTFDPVSTGDWVRLRTLIMLRWAAVVGQVAAILVARGHFDIALNLGLCLSVIGLSVASNLVAISRYPETMRLSERGTVATLAFDTVQLALLLSLTGGLNNPFALLLLVPGTIAATVLPGRGALAIGLLTIVLATALLFVHVPLRTASGALVAVPAIFEFGFWIAISVGVVFLGLYARRIASEIRVMRDALLATQMALAREQKLTDLGGVVAAAAHELGTPLATIKLASAELARELAGSPDLKADAELIRDQADRCRDILRSMGRAGKDDLHLRRAPLSTVVREAAEPHAARGRALHFDIGDDTAAPGPQPVILRKPEIIHGLRNLIQNAVDFSVRGVWIDAGCTDREITLRIADDGPGYPPHLIGRIGDPFMPRRRDDAVEQRPEYDGMGLGLFIAKTLLERTGASLRFYNGSDPFLTAEERPERSGAIVEVSWPRAAIEVAPREGLGENIPIVS
ncbi:MAG: ActS/PrrB/RegB family redox-sensitive histidine kinase [Rhodobacteraceae bacterium]|nr:ActS/PrrB/RegB family redox-sensitive histidine kinase [Paracoccaceae bacterium]